MSCQTRAGLSMASYLSCKLNLPHKPGASQHLVSRQGKGLPKVMRTVERVQGSFWILERTTQARP